MTGTIAEVREEGTVVQLIVQGSEGIASAVFDHGQFQAVVDREGAHLIGREVKVQGGAVEFT
jgi:hypothetical protein